MNWPPTVVQVPQTFVLPTSDAFGVAVVVVVDAVVGRGSVG